jgi:hypothetical protein
MNVKFRQTMLFFSNILFDYDTPFMFLISIYDVNKPTLDSGSEFAAQTTGHGNAEILALKMDCRDGCNEVLRPKVN